MGKSLSPFLCNLYTNRLEDELQKNDLFPRIWHRYVDDIVAVVDCERVEEVLQLINGVCPHIQFTVEREESGRLPFLDLVLERNDRGGISFDIYRKPTSTDRYITVESHHYQSHKLAAFNSMVYRMCNIPLAVENYEIEKQRIYRIAKTNGYSTDAIESLIRKHKKRIRLKNITTLSNTEKKKRVSMVYYEPLHDMILKCFDRVNVCVAAKSTTKIQQLLATTKVLWPDKERVKEESE